MSRWQPLIIAMGDADLETFGSWLIDEAADLAWSSDDPARSLNWQLQRFAADEQERRAELSTS